MVDDPEQRRINAAAGLAGWVANIVRSYLPFVAKAPDVRLRDVARQMAGRKVKRRPLAYARRRMNAAGVYERLEPEE